MYIILDVVLELQENEVQEEHHTNDDKFETEIQAITEDLENYAFHLVDKGDMDLEEYRKKSGCLRARFKESITLINAFSDGTFSSRKENILTLARKGSRMIKEGNDAFYKLHNDWGLLLDEMKGNNEVLNSLLAPKGVICSQALINSLYLLLEAESVDKLDSLWEEYQKGHLTKECRQKLFSGKSSNLQIFITEENYRKYRHVLGRFFLSVCCI